MRGEFTGDKLTVRIQGGTVGNRTEICEYSPVLSSENEYLLFLYKPGHGGAYDTDGDYYVLGLVQGAFVLTGDGDYISESGTLLKADDINKYIETAPPVNLYFFREEYISNQERNLETGFITQEEFDYRINTIDEYAKIVK